MRENYEIRKSYLLLFEYKHTYYVSTAEGHQFDNQTFLELQQSLKIQHFGYWLIGWNLALLKLLFFQSLFVCFLFVSSFRDKDPIRKPVRKFLEDRFSGVPLYAMFWKYTGFKRKCAENFTLQDELSTWNQSRFNRVL